MTGEKVTVLVSRLPVDESGNLLIMDNHKYAVAAFIKWMLAENSRWTRMFGVRFQKHEVDDFERKWHRQCMNARAEDDIQESALQERNRSRVNDPWSGVGIQLFTGKMWLS